MDWLAAGGCPLCGKDHRPKFHCYAGRTYKKSDDNDIGASDVVCTLVPRFFCEINFLLRQKTGEKKQYTITILPGFLVSHSTIPVDRIHQALHRYITQWLNQVGAAIRMDCVNPISFRLFLCRARGRLEDWIKLLIQMVLTLEGQVKEAHGGLTEHGNTASLEAKWEWFVWLANEYVGLYARLPEAKVVPRKYLWQYIYAALSRNRMGLGP